LIKTCTCHVSFLRSLLCLKPQRFPPEQSIVVLQLNTRLKEDIIHTQTPLSSLQFRS
ncbi:unnamed protein product, partial [Bubo scandiacus]